MASFKFTEPWGWSKLDTYRTCPQQFKYKFMDRLREPESEALRHGNQVHKAVEAYLNGWVDKLTIAVSDIWRGRLKTLRDRKPKTEAAWGLDSKWSPLKNWFGPTTWLRAKSDVYAFDGDTLDLIDMKSGKYRVPSTDQVELYSIVGHAFHPEVKRVKASFWFLEQDSVPHEEVYEAEQLVRLRGKYTQEALKLYKDRKFPPKPGGHCRYCNFSRQRGGPCQY